MTTTQTEGDSSLQCPQITSSSDLYSRPFVSKYSIRGRNSIRRASSGLNIIWYNISPENPTEPNSNLSMFVAKT